MTHGTESILLQPHVVSGGLRAASWGDLFITEWLTRASAADMRDATRAHRAFALSLGARKHATLGLVHNAAVYAPPADVQAVFRDGYREIDPHVKAGAIVLMTEGFGGAIVRSLITGMAALRSSPYPNKVFSTPLEACAWLNSSVVAPDGQRATRAQLAQIPEAITMLRAAASQPVR